MISGVEFYSQYFQKLWNSRIISSQSFLNIISKFWQYHIKTILTGVVIEGFSIKSIVVEGKSETYDSNDKI